MAKLDGKNICQHRMVRARGINFHVVTAGPEGGKPVMLLHGFPEYWFAWRRQIIALAEAGYQVWAPDQRGYNRTDKPKEIKSYGLDSLVEDVVELIRTTGSAKVSLIGHDWGGVVAWWLAAKYPERLEKLVIINAPHPVAMFRRLKGSWKQKMKSWYMLFFQLPYIPEFLFSLKGFRLLADSMVKTAKSGAFSPEDMERYRSIWSQSGAMTAMLAWYRALLRYQPTALKNNEIQIPSLILWGRKDHVFESEIGEASAELCRQGHLIFSDDAGHWVHHEKPAWVNEEILKFLGTSG